MSNSKNKYTGSNSVAGLLGLLKRPIVTEKTTLLSEKSQYVFEVEKNANKVELAKAFELAFTGRTVKKVRLAKIPHTTKRMGRHIGNVPAGRKAIFTIEGDPIELFAG